MIFIRSIPTRRYLKYTAYRPYLRSDFKYRCSYCLLHESHNGGEANFTIDHHRPRGGNHARPDLENEYTNLYWTCRECNQNKGSTWPSSEQLAAGYAWIDPCETWGDHDLHWKIDSDGEISWKSTTGEFTIKHLRLNRRSLLKRHWRNQYRWRLELDSLQELVDSSVIPEPFLTQIAVIITELKLLISEPTHIHHL